MGVNPFHSGLKATKVNFEMHPSLQKSGLVLSFFFVWFFKKKKCSVFHTFHNDNVNT